MVDFMFGSNGYNFYWCLVDKCNECKYLRIGGGG